MLPIDSGLAQFDMSGTTTAASRALLSADFMPYELCGSFDQESRRVSETRNSALVSTCCELLLGRDRWITQRVSTLGLASRVEQASQFAEPVHRSRLQNCLVFC